MRTNSDFISPNAWKEVGNLPGRMRQRARRAIDSLTTQPRPANSRQLTVAGLAYELRRIRIDRWRIVYAVDEAESPSTTVTFLT